MHEDREAEREAEDRDQDRGEREMEKRTMRQTEISGRERKDEERTCPSTRGLLSSSAVSASHLQVQKGRPAHVFGRCVAGRGPVDGLWFGPWALGLGAQRRHLTRRRHLPNEQDFPTVSTLRRLPHDVAHGCRTQPPCCPCLSEQGISVRHPCGIKHHSCCGLLHGETQSVMLCED